MAGSAIAPVIIRPAEPVESDAVAAVIAQAMRSLDWLFALPENPRSWLRVEPYRSSFSILA